MDVDVDKVEISRRPLTLGQMAYVNDIGKGNWASLIMLIHERTDLTLEQARALDLEDATKLMTKIAQAYTDSVTLQKIAQGIMSPDQAEGWGAQEN